MENYFAAIQDYLEGVLPDEDRQQFEAELGRNPELRAETALQAELGAVMKKHLAAEEQVPALRQSLQAASRDYASGRTDEKGRVLIRWLLPAASIAAALLILVYQVGWFSTDFEQLPVLSESVSRGGPDNNQNEEIAKAFNAGAYARSAELLEAALASDTGIVRYTYYLGLSHLGNQDYVRAVAALKPVADGPSVFAADARYFLAVALWRLDRVDEAREAASRVTKSDTYHKKSQRLLRRLEK
ncbi:MAG TPA: CDC27 family protein [Parapedobacter sp.]|nr:CDC27 family protein [Parapedobacter sp.]